MVVTINKEFVIGEEEFLVQVVATVEEERLQVDNHYGYLPGGTTIEISQVLFPIGDKDIDITELYLTLNDEEVLSEEIMEYYEKIK